MKLDNSYLILEADLIMISKESIIQKINTLDWCPKGEAFNVYNEFIQSPFYDNQSVIFKLAITLIFEKKYNNAKSLINDYFVNSAKKDVILIFLSALCSDLLNERELAINQYRKVLESPFIPFDIYDQLNIRLSSELIKYLIINPYDINTIDTFYHQMYENYLNEPYEYENPDKYPRFFYDNNDIHQKQFREKYGLDQIAGNGDEISRIVNIMKWVHNTVQWDGQNGIKADCNALSIINEAITNKTKFNCRGVGITLSEAYLSLGYKSRFVVCKPKNTNDPDSHIVTVVFSKTKYKWLFMDACFESYIMNENNDILSIYEIRERFTHNKAVIYPDNINVNNNPNYNCNWYKEYYLKKNFYQFEVPLLNGFAVEDKNLNKICLVPKGYKQLKFDKNDNGIVSNPDYFWEK
jgi:hypothetical protein